MEKFVGNYRDIRKIVNYGIEIEKEKKNRQKYIFYNRMIRLFLEIEMELAWSSLFNSLSLMS